MGQRRPGGQNAEGSDCVVATQADIVAAGFAAAGPGASFDPLGVQKLLFLIDREGSDSIGGPFFNFRPYHYGPFDRAIYGVLDQMIDSGTIGADGSRAYPRYFLSSLGRQQGEGVLASLPDHIADYFGRVARWVRLMPYRQILAAIYREYPEMAVNSVVDDLTPKHAAQAPNPFVQGMTRAFDITGTMHRASDSESGPMSTEDAIRDVWRNVGRHLEQAMVRFGEAERLW